jgi:hypothetical protein
VCTAGLVAEHGPLPEYGADVEDFDPGRSLHTEPTVLRLQQAANLLGEDIWINVALPGEYQGADDLPDDAAVHRWTTVVRHDEGLTWLRDMLALAAAEPADDQDDVDPL